MKFAVAQAANREAGASAMLTKLSEVFFAETLRRTFTNCLKTRPDGSWVHEMWKLAGR